MKTALFAVALGALVAVNGSEENEDKTPLMDSAFNGALAGVDWSRFSPANLGMRLHFEEMSTEELEKVVAGFIKMGLIDESEKESFMEALVDPRMRAMLEKVQDNWGETMNKILADAEFSHFLKHLKGGVDENALAAVVGLEGGLAGAVKRIQEQEEQSRDQQ